MLCRHSDHYSWICTVDRGGLFVAANEINACISLAVNYWHGGIFSDATESVIDAANSLHQHHHKSNMENVFVLRGNDNHCNKNDDDNCS